MSSVAWEARIQAGLYTHADDTPLHTCLCRSVSADLFARLFAQLVARLFVQPLARLFAQLLARLLARLNFVCPAVSPAEFCVPGC